MPPTNNCCNPLLKSKHNSVYEKLKCVTNNWKSVFSSLIGLYVCDSCRRTLSNEKVEIKKTFPIVSEDTKMKIGSDSTDEELGKIYINIL